MSPRHSPAALLLLLPLFGACADSPTAPQVAPDARLAHSAQPGQPGGSACAASPTYLATSEAELHAAVAAAAPGDIVGISGSIALEQDVIVERPGITITCAAAGAGLSFAPPNARRVGLIEVYAANTTVRGLELDARGGSYALYALRQSGVALTHSRIQCGGGGCAFFVGTPNATVTDNHATSARSSTGLHFQELIDGSTIARNTVVAEAPVGAALFGGIRPRDGVNVVVTDNQVLGPWSNGISVVNVSGSSVLRNRIEGAAQYGLAVNIAGSANVVFSRDNLLRANRVSGVGAAGYLVRNACSNEFTGNPVLRTSGPTLILDVTTGANRVVGMPGEVVDAGAFDCDGDGSPDPNQVAGAAAHASPSAQGALASRSARAPRGLANASAAEGVSTERSGLVPLR